MKKDIHPIMEDVTIVCTTCHKKFKTQSTEKEIRVDTCSNCHSFYTNKLNLDKAKGRVEKLRTKYNIKKKK